MGDERASNLKALEALLDEFFAPSTNNTRKAEIEKMLKNFSDQNTAWKDCLYFLTESSNHYVCMFSLTTLETIIHQRWVGMFGDDRGEIRVTLNNFLSQHHVAAPMFIRNKLIKLIVDIARSDWPHFYPEFFTQILTLLTPNSVVTNPTNVQLGLTMLLTASEELATPRPDIATSRADELRKQMLGQVGHVSMCLVTLLEVCLDKDAASRTPSPSDSEDSNSMDGAIQLKSNHVTQLPLDPRVQDVAEQSLACLAHIFTWCSPSLCVSSRLINVLFQYATLTIKTQGKEQSCNELSTKAMSALNEIIYKNYVPQDFNEYLVIMLKNCYQLLQSLVGDQVLQSMDESYLAKVSEFLRLFLSLHLSRLEQTQQFPILEFLALIFKFTFQQSSIRGFSGCLEIWSGLVEYVGGCVETKKDQGREIIEKYQEALLSLVVEIIKKSQFRVNSLELSQLDEVGVNEEGWTEWQLFLITIIELTMKVGEILPEQVQSIVDVGWREVSKQYLELDRFIVTSGDNRRVFSVSNDEQVDKMVTLLKDLSSFLKLVGRLSDMFTGEHFLPRLKLGLEYVKHLLALVGHGSKHKLWTVELSFTSKHDLRSCLIQCHAETIAALKAWCHWLASLHTESLQDSSYTWLCSDLTSNIVKNIVPVIKDTSVTHLTHSGAHFLVTLTGTVRPASIWKLKDFTDLYNMIHQLELQPEAHRLLVRSLTNVLLLPWPGTQEQKWDDRRKHCTKFLRDLTVQFRSVKDQANFANDRGLQSQAEHYIVHTLQMVGDLVDNVLNEVTQTKKLCYDVAKEYIETSLWLFPLYVHSNKVCEEMFQFFYTVFDVLKSQMGAQFVEQSIQTFFSMFGSNHLTEVLLQRKGSLETKVVEKFLSILTFIVSEPGAGFRKFVSSTLSLCLETIFPLIADQPGSEIKTCLYTLLHHCLLHNWSFFFKSNLKSFQGNNNDLGGDSMEHREEFLAVMKAIGHSFLQTDIAVFSQNVATLEQLNAKWRLYSKQVFKDVLLADFLSVFIRALINKSHNLLKDEIGAAVYNMGATDFPVFFSKFIPQFVTGMQGLDDNQRQILADNFHHDTDLPSFMGNLDRFVTDLRYYQLVNNSLPQGTVKF